jgi:WD40 repeat protein
LEKDTQVGEEWEDKETEVLAMALSPGGKTVVTGNMDGAVKLWNVDTGKVIKKWTEHICTGSVRSVYWSPDGGRVVSGSEDGMFSVWDIESGETIIGPINAGEFMNAVCYSPDGKMIATGGHGLKIWNANSGELLKTLEGGVDVTCLAWTSDGKTLMAGGSRINTATWTVLDVREQDADTISLSPNERILASISRFDNTVGLWNLETNQPIGTPLHHEVMVITATFSADGKFLVTTCYNGHIYTWDVFAIKEAEHLSNNVSFDTFNSQ